MQIVTPERSPAELIGLVDALIAAYVTWRTESSAVATAYRGWSTCGHRQRDALFNVYVAALDHEERAATTCRGLLEQITTLETELRGSSPRPDLTARPQPAARVRWSARSIAHRLGR
jgi:hypothetical protein